MSIQRQSASPQLHLNFNAPPARALPAPPEQELVRVPRVLPHFVAHSETSREAAIAFRRPAATLRDQVLAWFRAQSAGGTDMEAARAFPERKEGTVRARRCELVEAGLLRDSGRTALNGGRRVVVWEVVPVAGRCNQTIDFAG